MIATLRLLLLLPFLQEPAFKDTLTPQRVVTLKSVTSASVSPDGSRIAYVLSVPRQPGKDEDGPAWAELHLVDAKGGDPAPYVTGEVNVSNVEWTADGKGLSFLCKRGKDKARSLYVIAAAGGEARVALALPTDISSYSWSPDGKRVAVIATDEEPEAAK